MHLNPRANLGAKQPALLSNPTLNPTNICGAFSFMASTIFFRILNRSQNPTTNASLLLARSYCTGRNASVSNLFLRISPLGDPSHSVVPVLDQWMEEGKRVKKPELQHIARELRARRRYRQALEVS
jgi:hypothetical protein